MAIVAEQRRLGAYRRLSRRLFPRSYAGKVFLVTFVAAHVPLIMLVLYLLGVSDLSAAAVREILLVGLIATLVGVGLTLSGLWVMLAPVTTASQALDAYRRSRARPNLPVDLDGEGGRLLANVHHTLTHLDEVIARLEASASRDGLTGVLNRREGERRLGEYLRSRQLDDVGLALFILDADGMKAVNDRWGHAAGDTCIRHLATIIEQRIGGDGWVARWGGDEFVAVLPEVRGKPSAESVLQGITGGLAEETVLLPSGDNVSVFLSAGIARAEPGDDAQALLERADAALYRAKRDRGTVTDTAADLG